ncbi:MAG: hypothetical protein K0Q73_6331 [Paenibacillus sp.]|nr:hypothetical protein [Paenibacillus sp.]
MDARTNGMKSDSLRRKMNTRMLAAVVLGASLIWGGLPATAQITEVKVNGS